MSRVGLSPYGRPRNLFLKGDASMSTEREYSENIAAEIDEGMKLILDQAQATARKTVETIAARLLEKELILMSSFFWQTGRRRDTPTRYIELFYKAAKRFEQTPSPL